MFVNRKHKKESIEKMRQAKLNEWKYRKAWRLKTLIKIKTPTGDKNPNWRGGKVKKICKICSKKFYVPKAWARKSPCRCCSRECNAKDLKLNKKRAGENNANWKGGLAWRWERGYNIDKKWNKLRKKVYARDTWQCQICGTKSVVLECHHIIPWRISRDDSITNLLTVCRSCHKRLEAPWRKVLILRK